MAMVSRTLVGSGSEKVLVLHRTISDADLTASVIYNNSSFVNNPLKGNLMGCIISGSDCLVSLSWDQTTPSPLLATDPVNSPQFNFSKFGGIYNPMGTGATGNILVTTSGLATGKSVTIVLWIYQN